MIEYVGMSKPKKYVNKVGMGNSKNKIKVTYSYISKRQFCSCCYRSRPCSHTFWVLTPCIFYHENVFIILVLTPLNNK